MLNIDMQIKRATVGVGGDWWKFLTKAAERRMIAVIFLHRR